MSDIDPLALVQSFDDWHLAMVGDDAHEQMLQRRWDAQLDRQIEIAAEAFAPFFTGNRREPLAPVRIDADGYFTAPLTTFEGRPFDPAGV